MALTKGGGSIVIDWTAVPQNVVIESSEFDASASYTSAIIIQAALDTTTAHTGTEFIVMVTAQNSGNEDWGILTSFVSLIGTAKTENLTNNPLAAASATLTMADTDGFETLGEGSLKLDEIPGWRFIKDGVDIEDSELIYQLSFVTDTSITFADGTANAHVQNTPVWNIAISRPVSLPDWTSRAKIIVRNSYDSNGSTLNYRVLGGTITAV